ncbi:MAG: hypothetical protein HPY94_02305 [Clostridia bacterium]|nr:hypothetical protein [Clostridia bacterium]
MSINPFELKAKKTEDTFMSWNELAPRSYKKNSVDPYTKTRIILMNGTEYEAVWFGHNFSRKCDNNDIRRALATTRRVEQQQQKRLASLKPINETQLETTISYEQLAVDLTAFLAQRATDKGFKAALDFALLEDFDHLYRYADLLENDTGIRAETLVGNYTEIMPGRPTIAHHRHPNDSIKRATDSKKVDLMTTLDTHIITAAEQQTMNYYMNLGAFYKNDAGRKLYSEIGMVEEQHVSQYGSFIDTNVTLLECNLMHEYTECYLYYSMYEDETDAYVKSIWEQCFNQELSHLQDAVRLLRKYENKDWQEVIPNGGVFPALIQLKSNKDYVREVLANTVSLTAKREGFKNVGDMPANSDFFKYQHMVNGDNAESVESHRVIENYIIRKGEDYRFQTKKHPVKELQCRTKDNTKVGITALKNA